MPATLDGIANRMFQTLAPEMNGANRVALSNLWLLGPLVRRQLEQAPSTNAMLRTTTSLTIVQAGNKDNVLPGHAEATVNFRLLPGDTLADVEAHVRKTIADDRIVIKPYPGNAEPTPVASSSSAAFNAVQLAVRQAFPDAVVAPGLYIAGSDSRHFVGIADDVYRFSPFRANGEDLARFHGTNERLAISNYGEMIQFYRQLLSNPPQPQ
jgi:carboxypeptidase PM20D1